MKKIAAVFALARRILGVGGAIFLFTQTFFAQKAELFGLVTNEKSEVIEGAVVFWKANPKIGAATDERGNFNIKRIAEPATLVVRFIGFAPVEIEVQKGEDSLWVEVKGVSAELTPIIVTASGDVDFSTIGARNIEFVTSKDLKKAPCCNLSEGFENTGAVDVQYTNAVTGAKEIQLLGLRGIYSQLLIENRPAYGGIAQPYQLEFLPGTWLNGFQIAKGASQVMNGFAGLTGTINVDLQKPWDDKPVFVNLFASHEGRGEANVHFNKKWGPKWSAGLLTHVDRTKSDWDHNHDGFLDGPNKSQANALGRVNFETEKVCAQVNFQALTDRRDGGQTAGHVHAGGGDPWLFDQKIDRAEVFGKLGFKKVGSNPWNKIGNIGSASWHRMTGFFGPKNAYAAVQKSAYWQSIYSTILGNTNHKLNLAGNFQYDDVVENLSESPSNRREIVPGGLVEYTFERPNLKMGISDWVVVAGFRADFHNRFGFLATPRLSAKYNFSENTVVRMSAGRGFRSPNALAENFALLASNRDFEGVSTLKMEKAWNFGLNFGHSFSLGSKKGSLNVDLFRSDFQNQAIVDIETDVRKVLFYNLEGRSFSNSALVMWNQNLARGLDLKIAWKFNDVRATYQNRGLQTVPLVSRHRGLVALDWESKNKKWMINGRTGIVGPSRLPDNSQVPAALKVGFEEGQSPTYAMVSGQITRKWTAFEVYAGAENLGDFQQHAAILAANEPNSPFFNASQIWAPTMGRTMHAGLRWWLK